jgi:Chaperone of endosialidase
MKIKALPPIFAIVFLGLIPIKSFAQIGINSTNAAPSPNAMLDVSSTNKGVLFPRISSSGSIASPTAGLLFYNTTTNKFNHFDGTAWQESTFGNQWNVNGSAISYSGGNVGIGTATPAAQLNIFDNSSPRLQFNNTNTGTTINDGLYIGNNNVSKGFIWNYENAALALGTNNIERMTILSGGNVGIGEPNPTEKLEVNGNIIAKQLALNPTGVSANANAILDMVGTDKGVLFPRMTTAQRNLLPIVTGLTVYDITTKGFWFHDGTAWQQLSSSWTTDESVAYTNAKNNSPVVGIGLTPLPTSTTPATPGGSVTNGRLQIVGSNNSDQITIRHPNSSILKWGFYVSAVDSSLNFYYNGSLRANIDRVTGVYAALSDRNFKKNITSINPVLDNVLKLNAYKYNFIKSEDSDRKSIGFMAQDVLPYFPELVFHKRDRETDQPFLMMDYAGFGVIAIKAIQEQQTLIDALRSELNELKTLVGQIKAQVK